MCYASPGTRCSTTAVKKLREARRILDSVDPNNVEEWLEANDLVRQEEYEYSMSAAGIKDLKAKAVATNHQNDIDIYENTKAIRETRNKIARANSAKKKAELAAIASQAKDDHKAKTGTELKEQERAALIAKRNNKTLVERDELLAKDNEKLSQHTPYELENITGRKPITTPYYLSAKSSFEDVFDYDYERSSCHCDDDYCRCTSIEGGKINNENVPTRAILASYLSCKEEEVPEEYVDYATNNLGVGDISNYQVTGSPGYYGEEVAVEFYHEEDLRKYLSEELESKGLGHSPLDVYSRSNGVEILGKTNKAKVTEILKASGYKNVPVFKSVEVSPVHVDQLDQKSKDLLEHTPKKIRPYNPRVDYQTVERDSTKQIQGIFLENPDGTYSILGDQAVYKHGSDYGSSAYGIVVKP